MEISVKQIGQYAEVTVEDINITFNTGFLSHPEGFKLMEEFIGAAYELADFYGWSGFEDKLLSILHDIEHEKQVD